MKKKIISGVILAAVFVAALIGFSVVLNRGTDDMTADMGGADLPVVSFEESGYEVNALSGYTESMDIPSMRDLILPLSVGTTVKAEISGYSGKIQGMTYEVCTLDGKESIKKETVKDVKDAVNIELGDTISDGEEKVLKMKLDLNDKKSAYYYIRIVRAADFNVQQCLEFAEDFHNKTLNPEELNSLKTYLTKSSADDTDSLQTVTLGSGIDRIGWSGLSPEVQGDIRWQIKESNETYTSICLKYQVTCKDESEETDLYNVTEFFKVRFLKGKATLEDYERTMNQVFTGEKKDLSKNGIELGIASEDVPYLVNKDGDILSFVQEREVWSYNKKENEISLVFSFADAESKDIRNYNDNHEVQLLDMDDDGNTTFTVNGYMNRGVHEGQTGTAIYYYDVAGNYVEEKAFIPSKKSGEIVQKVENRLVCLSEAQDLLYVMQNGTLHEIDLETQGKTVLVKNLEEGQYVVSEDGQYIAYQSDGALTEAQTITVKNLKTGKSFEVKADKEEVIRPLGFVLNDVIYGIGRKADIGKTVSGETVVPLYKTEIRNQKNKVAKTYQADGIYVTGVQVDQNMVTLERVQKSGDVYAAAADHYITNNKEQEQQSVTVETYTSETAGMKVRLAYAKKIENTSPKILKPKQMLYEKPTTITFNLSGDEGNYYVYGHGKLQGIYDKAGTAIVAADEVRGVVVTSKQTKVWERGNRQLRYSIEGAQAFAANSGESSLAACLRQMLSYEGKNVNAAAELADGKSALAIIAAQSGGEALDLSGCTIEELCYIIGKGTPVIAMTGNDSAILLVGYDDTTVTYLNPATGKKPTETIEAVEEMVKGSQGTFIGYVK